MSTSAAKTMDDLEKAGISMKEVTDKLVVDGVKLFADAFKQAAGGDGQDRRRARVEPESPALHAAGDAGRLVKASLDDWKTNDKVERLWQRDASLWTGTDEGKWLGWLDITEEQLAQHDVFQEHCRGCEEGQIQTCLLLGMGGSSLCPEVLRMTFGKINGFPELHVSGFHRPGADPSDRGAGRSEEHALASCPANPAARSSRISIKQYFFERVKQKVGAKEVGNRFIAITDPGSKMQQVAEGDKFRHIFFGRAQHWRPLFRAVQLRNGAGGGDGARRREISEEHARKWSRPAARRWPTDKNPGVVLGAILGTAAQEGRDKVTIIASPGISDLGRLARATACGIHRQTGKGIIPVDREKVGQAGSLRQRSRLRVSAAGNQAGEETGCRSGGAGKSWTAGGAHLGRKIRITWGRNFSAGRSRLQWLESIIGINAFNQPDVEASKIETKKLTSEYESTGKLPAGIAFLRRDGLKFYADEKIRLRYKAPRRLLDVTEIASGSDQCRRLFRGPWIYHDE